jgi:hypothetical protein
MSAYDPRRTFRVSAQVEMCCNEAGEGPNRTGVGDSGREVNEALGGVDSKDSNLE